MGKVDLITKGEGYAAVNIGSMDTIGEYSIIHPVRKTEIFGKLFLKDIVGATGSEISFNTIAPHTEVSYFHKHADNKETYIILRGSGDLSWH